MIFDEIEFLYPIIATAKKAKKEKKTPSAIQLQNKKGATKKEKKLIPRIEKKTNFCHEPSPPATKKTDMWHCITNSQQ
jgi:hypothetical protein